ncbi:peptidase M16 family protein [Striga asiatica]|uniref:Peptidase M16 family protein n=1 Tax=Striga asiatica TaxID=4170 RepID=A0A5A7PT74_STRAF|nr:peptidase M16 family protein [Striga asiatica]
MVKLENPSWPLSYSEEDVKKVLQMSEESIRAQERYPYTAFANHVREINYGNSYFFRLTPSELVSILTTAYPSTFSVVVVGNIDPATACPLGGIPRPPKPILNFKRDELNGLPFTFPSTVIRKIVRIPMVQAQCSVQLCFPVELKNANIMEDVHLTGLTSKLLETKIVQVLRFKHGKVRS